MIPSASPETAEDLGSVSCHGCGVYDASLRRSAHPSVISTIVKANERARVGIWCARCRGIEAAKSTAVSLLAGWWSLRGPKLTVAAIRSNLAGGQQSPSANARMLRDLARLECEKLNPEIAATFAVAAHAVQPQRENSRLIDDLRRAGHRAVVPSSPWRYAPWVPIAVLGLSLLLIAARAIPDGNDESVTEPMPLRVKRAAVAPVPDPFNRSRVNLNANAAELEKQLAAGFDRSVAHAYFRARLRELDSSLEAGLERGDSLAPVKDAVAVLGAHPGVSEILKEGDLKSAYDHFNYVLDRVTMVYHGGAPVDAMRRTAGESLNVTADIAVDAIIASLQGHDERGEALASQVDARAASVDAMAEQVRLRSAILTLMRREIQACIQASDRTS